MGKLTFVSLINGSNYSLNPLKHGTPSSSNINQNITGKNDSGTQITGKTFAEMLNDSYSSKPAKGQSFVDLLSGKKNIG